MIIAGAAPMINRRPRALSIHRRMGCLVGLERRNRRLATALLEEGDYRLAYELVRGHAAQFGADYLDAEFHAG